MMNRRYIILLAAAPLLILGICVFVAMSLPPTEDEIRDRFDTWRRAVETADWDTVWSMIDTRSTSHSRLERLSVITNKAAFIRERQTSYPGLKRQMRLTGIHRMTHVDDPYTFWLTVDIDYIAPESGEVRETRTFRFYATGHSGQVWLRDVNEQPW
jgi:hypothetical protein